MSQWAGEYQLQPLLDAGVSVYLCQKTMLHAKVILVDRSFAVIGSTNLNQRSLRQDDEISLAVDDLPTALTLSDHFEQDLRSSRRIEPGSWRRRGLLHRIPELLSTLLRRHT